MATNPFDPYQVQSGTYGDLKERYGSDNDQYRRHHIPAKAATIRAMAIHLYNNGVNLGDTINPALENYARTGNPNYIIQGVGEESLKTIPDPHIYKIFKAAINNSPAIRIPKVVDGNLPTNHSSTNNYTEDMKDLWAAAERDIRAAH